MGSEQNDVVSEVPELSLKGTPEAILRLGEGLARTKYKIDLLGKTGWGEFTANLHGMESSGEWDCPDDALTFLSKIFPFALLPTGKESLDIFRVPAERVIGRRWPYEHICTLLRELIKHFPGDSGYQRSHWSTALLAIKINEITGCQLHAGIVRR
ncbi:hypothetical protein ETR_15911 [Erwinia tracheiphila PSU-1]|nr:hypothetical protein ETR_15911 [Erwinia tracheiphila PSU-1]